MSNPKNSHMKALDVSKAILSLYPVEEFGEAISNLKLQKLLYYVQGFNLAVFNEPLFNEKIIAWQYGPVVKPVYSEYKSSGAAGIILPKTEVVALKDVIKSKKRRDLLKEVNDVYGQFSAVRLMNMTHHESPWKTTKINDEITHKKLRDYFLTQIK